MGNNKSVIIGFICAFCVMSFNFAEAAYAQQGGDSSTTSSPNPALYSQSTHNLDTCQTNELRFNLRNINFFRDNEYQGNLTNGYTLPGFRLLPSISYQPLKILNLEVGAYMLHYWGANKYPNLNYSDMPSWKGEQTQSGFHVLPFLRAQVALTPNFQIVIGSIYGSVHHGLIEPLYNPETALSGDPETGLQFLWDTRWFKFDTWVNWESFIFDGDYHQESFTYGLSVRFTPNQRLYFPLQILAQHRGGEINTEAEEREVKTWVNGGIGVGYNFSTGNRLIPSVDLLAMAAFYKQQTSDTLPFDEGYGIYAKASAKLWRFNISAAYWRAHDFITIHGNPLYGAMSIVEDDYTLDNPSLFKLQADYSQPIGKGLIFGFNAELFNNFACDSYSEASGNMRESNELSIAFEVYLRINFSFLLKRFK